MITVRDALELPALQQGLPDVVAGSDGLDREVAWVHVLDIPEATDLLRGRELVLSTGRGAGADEAMQRRFVESLAAEQAAALVVELGSTYRRALPSGLVTTAERCGFPLVALRRRVRFVEITQELSTALLSDELAELRHGDVVLRRLLDIVLRGDGLKGVLAELARTIRNPIVLEDAAGHLMRFDRHDAADEAVLGAWSEVVRTEMQSETPAGALAVDVRADGRRWGRLIGLELDGALHPLDRTTLERGAVALGVALHGRRQYELARGSGGSELLGELRLGVTGPADAKRRALAVGFPRTAAALVPLVAVWRGTAWSAIAEDPELAWSTLAANVRSALSAGGWSAIAGPLGAELLAVVAAGDMATELDATGTRDALATTVHGALARRGLREADIALAIGPDVPDWDALSAALERTARGAGASVSEPQRSWYDASRTNVSDLLFAMRSGPQLGEFVRDRVGPLLETGDPRRQELLRTLETYLAEGGRKASTARLLHLERQSLYYRLERIEELLGLSLDDEGALLELRLALRAARFFDSV